MLLNVDSNVLQLLTDRELLVPTLLSSFKYCRVFTNWDSRSTLSLCLLPSPLIPRLSYSFPILVSNSTIAFRPNHLYSYVFSILQLQSLSSKCLTLKSSYNLFPSEVPNIKVQDVLLDRSSMIALPPTVLWYSGLRPIQ